MQSSVNLDFLFFFSTKKYIYIRAISSAKDTYTMSMNNHMMKKKLKTSLCTGFNVLEEIENDDEDRAKGNSLFQLTERQRCNLYKGKAPGSPSSKLTREALARAAKKTVPPLDLNPIEFLPDREIDKRIQDDEKRMGLPNGRAILAFMSPHNKRMHSNDSERKRDERGRSTITSNPDCSTQMLAKNSCKNIEIPTLSNAQIDGITHALETESELVQEFETQKRADYLRRVAAAIFSTDDSSEDEDYKCRGGEKDELMALRKEAKIQLDKDARARFIAQRLKEKLRAKQSNVVTPHATPEPAAESFSNSPIPGPYLTLHQKGDFTRFEALSKRSKISRFSTLPSEKKQKSQEVDKKSSRITPFLPSTSTRGKKTLDFNFVHENGETERLRRWKYKMGLAS